MDLIELRANKWIPRRKKNEAMTREEVHRESVKESSQKSLGDVRIKKKPEPTLRPPAPVAIARPAAKDRFALPDPPKPEPVKEKEHRDKDRDREHRRDKSKERDRDRDSSRRGSRDRDRDGERTRTDSRDRSRGDDRKESRRTSSSDHRSSDRSRDRRSRERDHSRDKDKYKSRESRHRHGSKSKHSSSDRKSNDEEAVKKMSSALKEFGEAQDFNEVVQCVKELKSSKHWLVVLVAIQQSMDPSVVTRERNTALLIRLCQSAALSTSDFDEGVRAFLPMLDEVVEDCPHAAKWAAEMIASWVASRCSSLRFLNFTPQPDVPVSDHLEKLVGCLLQTLLGLVGLDVLKKEYQEAAVQETFLRQPLQDFIGAYKLSPLFTKG